MSDSEKNSSPFTTIIALAIVIFVAFIFFWPTSLVNPVRQPMTKVNGELRSIAVSIFDIESASKIVASPPVFSTVFVYGSVDEVFPDLEMVIDPLKTDDLLKDDYHPSNDLYRAAALKGTFVLMSVGPDGISNVTEDEIEEAIEEGRISESARLLWSYSPTNGSESSGDVFRVQY